MLASDRQDKILELLNLEGSVRNSNLVKILGVSLETIRRDLEHLENEKLLKKVHGGAILRDKKMVGLSYSMREEKNISEKIEIAKKVIDYIEDGETIGLNGSTTNIEVARLLKENRKRITVVTNSLLIANELSDLEEVNLILAGGIYNKKEFSFLGEMTKNFLNNFSLDKSFVGVGGFSLKRGATDFLLGEVLVQKKLVEISDKTIIVADSSKMNSNSLIKICDLNEIDLVITDSKLDKNIKSQYIKAGLEVID